MRRIAAAHAAATSASVSVSGAASRRMFSPSSSLPTRSGHCRSIPPGTFPLVHARSPLTPRAAADIYIDVHMSIYPSTHPQPARRALRRRALAAVAGLFAAAAVFARAGDSSAAGGAAALTGVTVEPDGAGVRILVALSGPFHYLVERRAGRVVIALDPVTAIAAVHTLAVGPVRGVRVRALAGRPPKIEITVLVSVPVTATDSFLDGRVLSVRLAPADSRPMTSGVPSTRVAPPDAAAPAPGPATGAVAPLGGPVQSERIGGRAVVARTVILEEGTGRLLAAEDLGRVAVSDPRVVGAVPVSTGELLLTARAPGKATVYVWEGRSRLVVYAVAVVPGQDPFRDVRRALATLFPDATITVTEVRGARAAPPAGASPPLAAAPPPGLPAYPTPSRPDMPPPAPQAAVGTGGVVLSGVVETQMDRAKAEDVARAFVPIVVNLLTVRRPVQLALRVEVVELSRSGQDALGISWGGGQQTPGAAPSLNGGVYNLQVLPVPGVAANGLDLLIAQLTALSQQGRAKLLARPDLVVLAGRSASLLLGGQVPVPVAGVNGTVTVEYKDFGVILTARPEYQDDGRVFLEITPEVSTLDFTDAVKVSGFTIPALRVRRARTMVAMRSGETLVLGGLLQRDDAELIQKIPLLGDLPVIGALFRSRSFQRRESDLVILVTPQLVEAPHTP